MTVSASAAAEASTFSSLSLQLGLANVAMQLMLSPRALMNMTVQVRWLLPMAMMLSFTVGAASISTEDLISLEVEKFKSKAVLNLELSSFRREVIMSLSMGSSTGTITQLWVHSLIKMEGLRLSSEAGSLSHRRGGVGPCPIGRQFSGAGGKPLGP